MSGKPRFVLTENGVQALYNQENKSAIIMQVIFLANSDVSYYLRLSDGKHVSPVAIILKDRFNPILGVGAVLAIHEVYFVLVGDRSDDHHPYEDKGLHTLYIKRCTLMEAHYAINQLFGSININASYVDAINHIHHILRSLDPRIGPNIRGCKQLQEEAEKLRHYGNNSFKQQEYSEAIAFYDTAKKKDPFDCRVWSNCSQAHFKDEEFVEAEQDAVIAIKLNPFIEKSYYRAAQAALKQPNNKIALQYASNGKFICGQSKDLQQIIDGIVNFNSEYSQGRMDALQDTILNSVSKTVNLPRNIQLIEKAVEMTHNSISSQVEFKLFQETWNHFNENTRPHCEEHMKELKKELKLKREKAKIKNIKLMKEEASKTYEDKKNKEVKEKEEEQKKQDPKREEEELKLKPINTFHDTLRDGRRLFEAGQLRQAIETFNRSLASCCPDGDNNTIKWGNKERLEVQTVQFVVGMCRIQSGRVYILDGMEIMKSLSDDTSTFPSRPAAHYWLGFGYEQIYLFKKAHYHACICVESLKSQKHIPTLKWPGTIDPIIEAMPIVIRENAMELMGRAASSRPTPKAKCRFKDCISTQGHPYAKEDIYNTDPDFKGFFDVTCEEFCTVSYHPCCWKAHKEQMEEGIGRMSDKDFLGLECITPDCTGKIASIRIFDETCKLKNELLKDKKEKKNVPPMSKQKKKKDKKKDKTQTSKSAEVRDKKKSKNESFSEDVPSTDKNSPKAEVSADHTKIGGSDAGNLSKERSSVAAASTLPIDAESLQTTQITILKPVPVVGEDEAGYIKPNKKNRKKNKKVKATVQPDLLGDPLEVPQSVQNEYLSRLRVLRHQREALEGDLTSLPKATSPVTPDISSENSLKLLDPENPFYLPQHLRDNPQKLESILQTKMLKTTSPNLQQETINTLLDFMYDWLKSEGPMSINDVRLREQVSENFPSEASSYVNQCGGIKEFLMQSIKFAMIDDVICVGDHVVQAQEMICKEIKDRMTSSRYLTRYSDGRKAKKFTHLLEDNKSTCSSTSSVSQLAGSGVSYASRGTSDSTLSASKMSNGKTNKTANKASIRTSPASLEELEECKITDLSLNPSAPEFEPCSNELSDEEEDNSWNRESGGNTERWAKNMVKQSDKELCQNLDHTDGIESRNLAMNSQNGVDETKKFFQSDEECEEDSGDSEYDNHLEDLAADLQQELDRVNEQNQLLNDKLCQVKSHFKSEINNYKQQLEDLKVKNKELVADKLSLLAQRESESRKFKSDMSRMQDEVKTFQSRNQSLELKCERSNDRVNELQAKLAEEQEVNMQIREEMKNLQESLTSSSRRAHEAEVKYMCIKKDLVEDRLSRTIERLSEEAGHMRHLLPHASEDTVPDRATLTRSIVAWDETVKSLRDDKRTFTEEGKRLLGMVNQGRPLNALPPGDLVIPNVPDISVAPLLCLGQKGSNKPSSLKIAESTPERVRPPSCSPQPPLPTCASGDPSPVAIPLIYSPSPLEGNPIFMRNGATAAAFNSGAIPKGPSTTPEILNSTKWPDQSQLLMSSIPWEYTEADTKPIIVGPHPLGVQAKGSKKPNKPTSLTGASVNATMADAINSNSSAYGLSDISLNASAEVSMSAAHTQPTPTLHQSTPLAVTKPKFQNLTSSSSVGAIGTLPPKLVRPQSRQAANAVKMVNQPAVNKEDNVASTASYKKLIEICKQKIGKDYTSPEICSALREVRIQNNNSLSGISTEKIVERVKLQLRSRHPGSGQATVAPWAGLTQGSVANASGPEWKGPVNEEGMKVEESCSICLEALSVSATVPLQCQHVFHEKCIKDWLKRQSNCPNCRTFALMTDEYPSLTHS